MAHLVTVERELLSVRHVELQAEAGWRWRIERAFKSQPGPWGCSSWTRQSVWQWSTQPTHPISWLKVKSPRGYLAEVGKIKSLKSHLGLLPTLIAEYTFSRGSTNGKQCIQWNLPRGCLFHCLHLCPIYTSAAILWIGYWDDLGLSSTLLSCFIRIFWILRYQKGRHSSCDISKPKRLTSFSCIFPFSIRSYPLGSK